MKKINIGGKDYTFEFTMEASLNEDCVTKVSEFMYLSFEAQDSDDLKKVIAETLSSTASTALSLFYAGLLEHHGDEIKSKEDAKNLVKVYFSENEENADWFSILEMMLETMMEDGFFKLIGLEKMDQQTEKEQSQLNRAARREKAIKS